MDTVNNLTLICSSKWLWLARCFGLRKQVQSVIHYLAEQLREEKDARRLLQAELDKLTEQYNAHLKEHQIAKDGNRALITFIHRRHRLSVKPEQGSIRELLTNETS